MIFIPRNMFIYFLPGLHSSIIKSSLKGVPFIWLVSDWKFSTGMEKSVPSDGSSIDYKKRNIKTYQIVLEKFAKP